MVKIGEIELRDEPLLLAPMEDVTDLVFRMMCRNFGADMVYTEFASSEAMIRDVKRTFEKVAIHEDERPAGIQIYGHLTESMVIAAKKAEKLNPDFIDLNFGCPVKKIVRRGAGAGMLRDLPHMIAMTEAVVKAVKLPITVKTRLGWDDDDKPIVEVAERIQDVGAAAITIHGRTRKQMYGGEADWSLIGEVKNNPRMKIPVFGNGDVDTGVMAREMFDRYGVDGIMIGRGSVGCPQVFASVRHYLDTGEEKEFTLREKVDIIKELSKAEIDMRGPYAVLGMRRHYAKAFTSIPFFREMRIRLLREDDPFEVFNILDEIADKYS